MRRFTCVVLAVAVLVSVSGCMSGPSYLRKSATDWHNLNYEASPLTVGLITDVIPFYPLVFFLAWIPDTLILNPIQFWGWDVWRGEGAAFTHENPEKKRNPWFLGGGAEE
jgi:hypothetical protein